MARQVTQREAIKTARGARDRAYDNNEVGIFRAAWTVGTTFAGAEGRCDERGGKQMNGKQP